MEKPGTNSKDQFNRRSFLSNAAKMVALAGLLGPFEQACTNKSRQKNNSTGNKEKVPNKKNAHTAKHNRKEWHHEGLLVNKKTGVLHLPTVATYIFYDQITSSHLQPLNMDNWESQVQGNVRFNKDKSGNILEALSLQKLRNDVNNDTLAAATTILEKSFSKDCENKIGQNINATNYRLHELMLQLIALNSNVSNENKWQAFTDKVSKPQKIGKRCKWMETESAFNERVKYISDREADYKKRLNQRASKYAFT